MDGGRPLNGKTVVQKGMSIRKAAKTFNFAFSTLQERIIKGDSVLGPWMGKKLIFSAEEERDIAEILYYCPLKVRNAALFVLRSISTKTTSGKRLAV